MSTPIIINANDLRPLKPDEAWQKITLDQFSYVSVRRETDGRLCYLESQSMKPDYVAPDETHILFVGSKRVIIRGKVESD